MYIKPSTKAFSLCEAILCSISTERQIESIFSVRKQFSGLVVVVGVSIYSKFVLISLQESRKVGADAQTKSYRISHFWSIIENKFFEYFNECIEN